MVKLTKAEDSPEGETDGVGAPVQAFSFGNPEPSLTRRTAIGFLEPSHNDYFDPPLPMQGLSESFFASPHHASAIKVKRNQLVSNFIEHEHLKRGQFSRMVLDYLVFGNGYLEDIRSVKGDRIGFKTAPSKFVRIHKNGGFGFLKKGGQDMHPFKAGRIGHLLEPDINQEIYGIPDYVAALHSAWLNESATLFRRRYYENGAHAGFIMYLTEPSMNEDDVKNLQKSIAGAKGPGNFRSLFINAPNGDKDGLKIIHLAEAQENARKAFCESEIRPLQASFTELNEWAGDEIIKFRPFDHEQEDGA